MGNNGAENLVGALWNACSRAAQCVNVPCVWVGDNNEDDFTVGHIEHNKAPASLNATGTSAFLCVELVRGLRDGKYKKMNMKHAHVQCQLIPV